ncbi:aminotransferase class IV [Halomonas sp.]|uniref:aminotransferase class IV n=1 Tax=Halomonas sp. TaxID=1486246 RepID=UPI000C8C025B|nr:aminotransferase class IV [Halomonas sp.]MAR71253.1 aminotransferase class IV [Halomonas sp.]MBR9879666.1 aminotransferase class IV [Gammaproteobacteria bacterium]
MEKSRTSSQSYVKDERNENVIVYVDGEFKCKNEASVSIFDSGFVLGDGIWEGIRLVNSRLVDLDKHLDRMFEGAKSISLEIGVSKNEMETLVWKTLNKNNMTDGVHIRLMVSRGKKVTPNQDPRFLIGTSTIVIVAEYKRIDMEKKLKGLTLFTSTFRCSSPDVFDLRLNSHSRLNFIQALIQAINAGADEALMLDPNGFVASCNSTNFFIVKDGELWTSTGDFNFKGITQMTVKKLARNDGVVVREKNFTLAEVYNADEAFVTGTLGGLTPVKMIDGRTLGNGEVGPLFTKVLGLYNDYVAGV